MAFKADLIRLIVRQKNELLALLAGLEREVKAPEPEPEPEPRFEPPRKGETELERMYRQARNDCALGKATAMRNPGVKARPPQRPGQQGLRFNGMWWHY